MNMRERGVAAARAYLERVGHTMPASADPGPPEGIDILGIDGETLVGTLVLVGTRPEELGDVSKRILDAAIRDTKAYRNDHHAGCSGVRVDTISLLIIAEDRALLRHHREARRG